MGGYQVTPEQLTGAAGACDTTADEVQAALTQLQTYVLNTEEWWQGIASGAFQGLMQRYNANARNLNEALTEIARRLRQSAAVYGEGEHANITTVTNIQQSLPAANLG